MDREQRLHAYLDHELDAAERAELEAELTADAGLRAELDELRAFDRELHAALGPAAEEGAEQRDRVSRIVDRLPGPRAGSRASFWVGGAGWLAAAASLALWFASGRATDPADEEDTPPASLAILGPSTGPVEWRPREGAPFQPLAQGTPVAAGATLRTGAGAKCTLLLADGSTIHCNQQTDLGLAGERRVVLRRGQIYLDVHPAATGFRMQAGATELEALGTELDLSHQPPIEVSETSRQDERTVLTVIEGTVRMGAEMVAADHRCEAIGGVTRSPEQVRELLPMSGWIHELLALDGRSRPELERRVHEMLAQLGRTKMELLYEWEIRSLGDHCVSPLAHFVQSADLEEQRHAIRRAASILADVATLPYLGILTDLLDHPDPEVRVAVASGLGRLAGRSLGFDEAYWRGEDRAAGVEAWERFEAER